MNHVSSKNVGLIHYPIKSLSINHPYPTWFPCTYPLRIADYTPVKDLLRGNCPTLLVVRSNCRSPQRSQSAQNARHDCGVLQLLFSNWVRWMILIGIATNNRKCPARALCVATGQLALAGPRLSQVWEDQLHPTWDLSNGCPHQQVGVVLFVFTLWMVQFDC